MISRRNFLIYSALAGFAFLNGIRIGNSKSIEKIIAKEFHNLPSPEYKDVSHSPINWQEISDGLDFARVEVYKGKELVDIIATAKIDPDKNHLRVFNGFNYDNSIVGSIGEWQAATGSNVMINSAQYMADPYYMPCALVLGEKVQKDSDKKLKFTHAKIGPRYNKSARGMLVGEPTDASPRIDLLDFEYEKFNHINTPYTQGVQHWPILLDRKGKIKVESTLWQANRTVVAKDWDKNILFMTTEGGYFTLYNFGRFLKDSNMREDRGLNIHTAMNMDGGYEACMAVKTEKLDYITHGEFETYGPGKDASVHGIKIKIPGVVGIFSNK